jgi:hypothetical protein
MRARVELRIGQAVAVKATVRATPAGLMAVAVLMGAILVPTLWLARGRVRMRPPTA